MLVVLLLVLGCGPAAAQCDVYVANRESNSVSVFNTLTDGLEAMIPVGNQPLRVAITPNRAFAYVTNSALRRNPAGWLIEGAFRYTVQFEEQRLDEDSGMAGLPGVSERDQ